MKSTPEGSTPGETRAGGEVAGSMDPDGIRGRPRRLWVAAVLAVLAAGSLPGAAGCAGREASDPALADSTYVSIMAQLTVIREAGRRGPRSVPDSLVRESVDSLLAEVGVDRSHMLEFARAVGDEPERMAGIWERIRARADSLRQAGWDPPGPVAPEKPSGEGSGPSARSRGSRPGGGMARIL